MADFTMLPCPASHLKKDQSPLYLMNPLYKLDFQALSVGWYCVLWPVKSYAVYIPACSERLWLSHPKKDQSPPTSCSFSTSWTFKRSALGITACYNQLNVMLFIPACSERLCPTWRKTNTHSTWCSFSTCWALRRSALARALSRHRSFSMMVTRSCCSSVALASSFLSAVSWQRDSPGSTSISNSTLPLGEIKVKSALSANHKWSVICF